LTSEGGRPIPCGVGQEHSSGAARPKLHSVQMLRGVGAMLVVGIHINNWLHAREPFIGPSHIAWFAKWHQFGAIGVDIFFVISGFVIALTMGKYQGRPGVFMLQRYLRIAPLAYIFSALWILKLYLAGRTIKMPGVISTIVLAPILPTYTIPTLDVLWTLAFEFTFYLFVVAILLCRKGTWTLFVVTAVLAPIGFFYAFGYPLLRFATHPMLLEFALGMAAFFLWQGNILSPRLRALSGLVGAAALIAEALLGSGVAANPALAISGETALRRVVEYALPTFLLINFLVAWEPRDTIVRKILVTIGDASYSIYLVHLFVISMLVKLIPLPPDGIWILLFLLTNIAGVAVYYCIEKPLARLASKVGKPRQKGSVKPVEVGAP